MITLVKNLLKTPLKSRKMVTITNPSLMTITNPNPSMGVVATKRKPITMNTKRKTPMMITMMIMKVATNKKATMIIIMATKRKEMTITGVATKKKTHPMPKNHIMTTKNRFMFSW